VFREREREKVIEVIECLVYHCIWLLGPSIIIQGLKFLILLVLLANIPSVSVNEYIVFLPFL
jgi:hypothetical protein